MHKGLLIRIGICFCVLGVLLYSFIEKQNRLTRLKMEIPQVAKQINDLKEMNHSLQYEIKQFENPAHLMELVRCPEFSHLKHPFIGDILTVKEGIALGESKNDLPLGVR